MTRSTITLRLRYLRRLTDPGVEMNEKNLQYAHVKKELPLEQTALIALDIWDRDLFDDMRARDDQVTREKIVPVVEACRKAGLQIIHAPTMEIARRSKNWVKLAGDRGKPSGSDADWPPQSDRDSFWFPKEARSAAANKQEFEQTNFHELVKPEGNEAVVGSGEELHRLCAQRKILHLLYVGFHTPGCMNLRDYGITEMRRRGYHCTLLRDCTNGMEAPEHFDKQTGMKAFIAFFERNWIYTVASHELIQAL